MAYQGNQGVLVPPPHLAKHAITDLRLGQRVAVWGQWGNRIALEDVEVVLIIPKGVAPDATIVKNLFADRSNERNMKPPPARASKFERAVLRSASKRCFCCAVGTAAFVFLPVGVQA